ncbi:hypothetical protein GGR53DRAFT_483496 [Hypoxylon sp. FL1150]|nr:hypothetical protein GGR53DRAFT_483496 [Hypoxylon sp. FL1150]
MRLIRGRSWLGKISISTTYICFSCLYLLFLWPGFIHHVIGEKNLLLQFFFLVFFFPMFVLEISWGLVAFF